MIKMSGEMCALVIYQRLNETLERVRREHHQIGEYSFKGGFTLLLLSDHSLFKKRPYIYIYIFLILITFFNLLSLYLLLKFRIPSIIPLFAIDANSRAQGSVYHL